MLQNNLAIDLNLNVDDAFVASKCDLDRMAFSTSGTRDALSGRTTNPVSARLLRALAFLSSKEALRVRTVQCLTIALERNSALFRCELAHHGEQQSGLSRVSRMKREITMTGYETSLNSGRVTGHASVTSWSTLCGTCTRVINVVKSREQFVLVCAPLPPVLATERGYGGIFVAN